MFYQKVSDFCFRNLPHISPTQACCLLVCFFSVFAANEYLLVMTRELNDLIHIMYNHNKLEHRGFYFNLTTMPLLSVMRVRHALHSHCYLSLFQ